MGKRGLTVAELLLILIILSILGYISYNEISNLIMNHRLRVSLDRLHSDIIKVRTYSIMKGNPWGIRLEPGKNCYVIFEDRNKDCRLGNGSNGNQDCVYSDVQIYPNCYDSSKDCTYVVKLEKDIKSNVDASIVFDRKGYPRNGICGLGMDTIIKLENLKEKVGKIVISRYGRIRVEK